MKNTPLHVDKQALLHHLSQVMDPDLQGRSTGMKSFVPGHSFAQAHLESFGRAVQAIPEETLAEFVACKQNVRVLNTCAYAAGHAMRTLSQNYFLELAQGIDPKTTTCIAEIEDEKFLESGATRRKGVAAILGGSEAKTYRDAFAEEQGKGAA